ncbi:MAG: helix-turn-helix domain-containing protein [Prolixibacteraceae bacterium]|nr:helix-turn-helix domain-containing protein [Prolixibacteraceae bacterium]
MQTNEQLRLAFNYVQYTGQNIFLTGKAGTGKTTFLKSLKTKVPKRMIVVAPTGVAAINAGGVTIHSFFQLSFAPQVGLENTSVQQNRFNKEKINIIRSLDLLVIDEISMVRADILDAIDRVLRRFRNRNKPFGGVQLLMIGDLQQLAPVVKNEEWGLLKREYETVFFFSSKALRKTSYVSIELTEVFRQQDDKFIAILNKVRDNKLDQTSLELLNQRYIRDFKPDDNEGFITLCTHNLHAHRINEAKLIKLKTNKRVFIAEIEGKFPEYSYPTNFKLELKVGAQVMFVKNDPEPEKLFYNGKIGKITRFDEDVIYVLCPNDDDEIAVTPLLWENIKYSIDKKTAEISESVEGSFLQYPLKLAWAITIHKSQGLTFERAIIDAEASFAHGQVYVALSRCKTLEGMVLTTPISGRSIINDKTVSGFIRNVEENQPGEKELNTSKQAYQKELLMDVFSFENIKMQVNIINKILRENSSAIPEVVVNHLKKIKQTVYSDLVDVSGKFQKQITQLLAIQPEVEQNEKLLERISKAAGYFSGKVKAVIIDDFSRADLEVDNRALRKQLKSNSSRLLEEAAIKLACFEICKVKFNVKQLLNTKAKTLLESSKATKKKKKAKEVLIPDSIPHPKLYNILRSWRYEKAQELEKPAFFVFSQKSLVELTNYLPVESKTLQLINGFGSKKIEQFGADIIEIIRNYCNENNVQRMEIPLKEVTKKEKKPKEDTKKVSFELYKSGKTVAEIAATRNLKDSTIVSHLAYFVGLGELDVNLFLNEDELKNITAYFKSTGSKSLSEAKAYFGDKVSYGQLRMGLSYLESLKINS